MKIEIPEDRIKYSKALIDYARCGDLKGIQQLLDLEISPNYISKTVEVQGNVSTSGGWVETTYPEETPLTTAAEKNQIEAAKLLLENKADVDLCFPLYRCIRHAQAGKTKIEMVKLLTDYGADVNLRPKPTYRGPDTLSWAFMNNCEDEIIFTLINKGANPSYSHIGYDNNVSVIHLAIMRKRSPAIIQAMIDKGADLTHKMEVDYSDKETCCIALLTLPCLFIPFICLATKKLKLTPLEYARRIKNQEAITVLQAAVQNKDIKLSKGPGLLSNNKNQKKEEEKQVSSLEINSSLNG